MARQMTDPLTSCLSPLTVPMTPDDRRGWKPKHLFKGATGIMQHLSCHASVLVPGCCPHPPHSHEDEEILLMLSGEADLVFPDGSSPDGVKRCRLLSGQFVHYPSCFAHTIEAVGTQPANYLMIRWTGSTGDYGRPLPFHQFDVAAMKGAEKGGQGFHATRFVEGPTSSLKKLEGHLSTLYPDAGYEPHADNHDVVIVILEGEVETLGQRIGPYGAIFYRAGEPHGMRNPGETVSRYLVFEFHGSEIPIIDSRPFRLLVRVIRLMLPSRLRRWIGRLLGQMGRKSGMN